MKRAYPIIMKKGKSHTIVFIPDFNINTQGVDYIDAIEMARDAIGLVGIDMEDEGEELPKATELKKIQSALSPKEFLSLVDVDFDEYRRKNDMRSVKKNCTIPSWLNYEAEKAGLNFSAILQNGLKRELKLSDK